MFLRFRRYGYKWYAETPTGEMAFSDQTGLYEWRGDVRIHYSYGDRQGSDSRGMWTTGPDKAHARGLLHVLIVGRNN
jgi:hypothetical protein